VTLETGTYVGLFPDWELSKSAVLITTRVQAKSSALKLGPFS